MSILHVPPREIPLGLVGSQTLPTGNCGYDVTVRVYASLNKVNLYTTKGKSECVRKDTRSFPHRLSGLGTVKQQNDVK
jgi:hypothetical protein